MSKRIDAYEKITGQIIEALEAGYIPWEKPWNRSGLGYSEAPKSWRGQIYRGFNAMLLGFYQDRFGYKDNRWITYAAAKKIGGHVKAGEKSATVTFWSNTFKHGNACKIRGRKGSYRIACDNLGKNLECQKFVTLKYYFVFNVDQCENLDEKQVPPMDPVDVDAVENTFDPIEAGEAVATAYIEREKLGHVTGSEAFYTPAKDTITMPPKESFKTNNGYYSTLFHELGHSTGHKSRVNRKDGAEQIMFVSTKYAKEELVAELTNAFISDYTGVSNKIEDDQRVAYIGSWLKKFKDDSKMVIVASGQAQKAADLIIGEEATS